MITTITTFFAGLALTISGFFGSDPTLGAQPALTVPQGGTGWSAISPGTLIYGTGSSLRLGTTSTTTASCSGSTTCDPFVVIGSSPITITSTGGSGGSGTVSTSSAETSGRVPFWTSTNGTPALLSGGVAGFAWNDTFKRLTATYASSTTFSATTIYGALVGNADTATALAADPANCSAGNAPLGIVASGAVEGCFDVWTEAENTSAGYVVGTRALTIAGTANQISSSAGSQNLTADRTWTLSLPNHVIFPSSFVTTFSSSTNGTTSFAGLSNIYAIGSNGLDFHSNNGTPVADFGGGGGSNASFFGGVNIDGTTRLATSLTGILKATAGTVSVATAGTDYANFGYPFTPATNWFSTSTISLNTAGFMSNASSTFHQLRSTYASSTYSSISGTASSSALIVSGLNAASCDLKASATGVVSCGTDATGGGGGSTDTVLWANASTSPWVASSLTALSSSTIAFLDMVRSTSTDSISTNASTSILSASSHIRSVGSLRVDGLTSAIALTGANGTFAEYTGAGCTNQVIEDLDALGAPTCRTITSAYVDSTISTFAFPFTPATSWTATSTLMLNTGGYMSVASSTLTNLFSNNLSIASDGTLVIPASADPTVNATGEIALDTTSGNIIFATSTAQELVLGGATTTLYAMVIASTSPDFASGGIIPLPAHFLKQQAVGIICKVDAGTSQQIFLSDSGSTNDTNTITCSTTETQYNITTNNIWTAYEPIQLEFATKSGSPDYITIRVVGFRTSD